MKITNHILYILLLIATISCVDKSTQQQSGPSTPQTLKVTTLKKQDVTTYNTYATTIQGKQNVEIWPKVSGYVQEIYVEEGQKVKKGQLLFKLETQSLNQDANAAKASVNVAQVEVDKLIPLVEKGIISSIQLETAKAKLLQAKSYYESLAANINYSRITSPSEGYIGTIPYKVGTLVSNTMAQPMTEVSDISEVRAYFSLNERELLNMKQSAKNKDGGQLRLNQEPEVELVMINGESYPLKGKIKMVNNIINGTTGSVTVRADFKNPDNLLSSGSTGQIKIPVASNNVFQIPQTATVDIQGNKMIFIVDKENKVIGKPIQIEAQTSDTFLVKTGLEEGMVIVTEGVSKLKDGQIISPIN